MPPTPPDDSVPQGRLDTTTLRTLGRRAATHPLVEAWSFEPDSASPRYLDLRLDANAYPVDVNAVRLEIHWFDTDDYYLHYLETRDTEYYQCRWDRHPNPHDSRLHFHEPPSATEIVDFEPASVHPLEVCSTVLTAIEQRLEKLWSSR